MTGVCYFKVFHFEATPEGIGHNNVDLQSTFAAMFLNPEIDGLLAQWASGNLNNIQSSGHTICGVVGLVHCGHEFRAQSLSQQFTVEDVDSAISYMLSTPELKGSAIVLILNYLKGWTLDRIGRAFSLLSTSVVLDWIIQAQQLLAEVLLNGQKEAKRSHSAIAA